VKQQMINRLPTLLTQTTPLNHYNIPLTQVIMRQYFAQSS
jgi:hypothetical protein